MATSVRIRRILYRKEQPLSIDTKDWSYEDSMDELCYESTDLVRECNEREGKEENNKKDGNEVKRSGT